MKLLLMPASIPAAIASTLCALMLTGCSMTWVSDPEITAPDGSKLIVTAFYKQYRRDALNIQRIDRQGNKSVHVMEDLPERFNDFEVLDTSARSITVRLLDQSKQKIEDHTVPYSSFVAKNR
ncbi:MAG: hypothetical protein EOP85_06955 [Verrucomicrobiaceae bacterium]|nr:MAG: hypothetical protein EOP85_06955 [Verrucomicrobiaceae bacterium]